MYSCAAACALTRVSVPSTGKANASMTTMVFPSTFPGMSPITSKLPLISHALPENQ